MRTIEGLQAQIRKILKLTRHDLVKVSWWKHGRDFHVITDILVAFNHRRDVVWWRRVNPMDGGVILAAEDWMMSSASVSLPSCTGRPLPSAASRLHWALTSSTQAAQFKNLLLYHGKPVQPSRPIILEPEKAKISFGGDYTFRQERYGSREIRVFPKSLNR